MNAADTRGQGGNDGALDSRRRFTCRVADYVRFRPGYPASLLDALFAGSGDPGGLNIADIGSGTGIFSRLLLERGATVHGVEPNAAMRAAAEADLAAYPGFDSVDGAAENSGLARASCDLVTAAQAFHWFANARALAEFARILKPGGRLALVWNRRRLDEPFQRAYDDLLREFAPEYDRVNHLRLGDAELGACFETGKMTIASFDNRQELDFDGLLGRLKSASYCPDEDSAGYTALVAQLDRLFAHHADGGRLRFVYDTCLYLGPIAR